MTAPEIERTSLADAFKGTGGEDAAGLSGILTPKKRTVSTPSEPRPKVEAGPRFVETATEEPTAAAPAAPAAAKPSATRSDPALNKVTNVPAYIDPDVLAAVRAARREGIPAGEPDKTYDELLVDALEAVSMDRLRAAFAADAPSSDGGLMQRRQRRQRGGGGIQIQLRMTKAQEQELTDLTTTAGAPSRSAFVTTAYRLAFLNS